MLTKDLVELEREVGFGRAIVAIDEVRESLPALDGDVLLFEEFDDTNEGRVVCVRPHAIKQPLEQILVGRLIVAGVADRGAIDNVSFAAGIFRDDMPTRPIGSLLYARQPAEWI